jgi:hypothetical protein
LEGYIEDVAAPRDFGEDDLDLDGLLDEAGDIETEDF